MHYKTKWKKLVFVFLNQFMTFFLWKLAGVLGGFMCSIDNITYFFEWYGTSKTLILEE